MRVSFRLRLFAIAGLLVAAVLCAVLLLGWSRVLTFEVQRLERRLCMEAKRVANQPFYGENLPRLEADIAGKLHLGAPDRLTLRFKANAGNINFESRNWPANFALDGSHWQRAAVADWPDAPRTEANTQQQGSLERPPLRPAGNDPSQSANAELNELGVCTLAWFSWPDPSAQRWRAARFTASTGRAVVAADLAASQAELQRAFLQALEWVAPLALVLTALSAWLLAALTMRPVNRLHDAMKDMTQNALDRRLSSAGEDREFQVLIDAYNTMLCRLESSFQQALRFSADAAHELKTPLTILQGRIEQALHQSVQPAMQAELTALLDEVSRLAMITRKLLLLSQADAGRLALHLVCVDVSAMLNELATDAQMLLTGQTLDCTIDRQLLVQADAVLLRQLFNNLISNAVRYCPPGRWIKITAQTKAAGIHVVFSNAARGIAPADYARFFDRFYRGDAAHSRHIDGTGLGLSLAREIARAHGGDLLLVATTPNEVALQLSLPRACLPNR